MSHSIHSHTLRLVKSISGLVPVLLLSTSLVSAGELTTQPTSVALAAKQPTASVNLTNSGSEEKIVRITVMSYSQENGRELLVPSTRLIVHPEKVTLQPGATQPVKVGMRMSGPLWEEETYRLLLTEVPPTADVGAAVSKMQKEGRPNVAVVPVSVLPPGRSLTAR